MLITIYYSTTICESISILFISLYFLCFFFSKVTQDVIPASKYRSNLFITFYICLTGSSICFTIHSSIYSCIQHSAAIDTILPSICKRFILHSIVQSNIQLLVITVLIHAASKSVFFSLKYSSNSLASAISHLLSSCQEIIKAYILIICPHVELVVQELVANKTVMGITKWWKMSHQNAEYFAGKFIKCIEQYPLILADGDQI